MILALLQARVTSQRLPRKVLLPLLGAPMVMRQIERVSRSKRIHKLLVVTSVHESDDPLYECCEREGVPCFRGSLRDVLDRFYQAAKTYSPEHVVRLTGDCPLADPALIDRLIDHSVECKCDYASNALNPTFPDGLDAEVIRFKALVRAWREAARPSEREHVTPYIYAHPELFRTSSLTNDVDLSHLRWTVDEQRDFEVVEAIYSALYPRNPRFSTSDILDFLAREPKWKDHNRTIQRNEGYQRSLTAERSGKE